MIGGFMLITAFLSAFVSNTATTSMMLPIALSVVALLRQQAAADKRLDSKTTDRFATCLLLAIAYSASIGGVMTIIGTPTNAFLVSFLKDQIADEYQREFTFASWLPIGVSLTAVFLPIMFLILTRIVFPLKSFEVAGGAKLIAAELKKLGKLGRGERITLVVFTCVVSLWLVRPLISGFEISFGTTAFRPFEFVNDSVIAMLGAISLFMIPVNVAKREFTMDWATAERLPWGVLLLFGGGLSLAAAVKRNGVAEFIGSQAEIIGQLPPILTVALVVTAIVFMTELTSNAATTASLVPILAALAPGLGIHPLLLVIPATIASSCAFMLPVATPPNAIVFGSGLITVPQMIRAGFLLNLVSILLVTLLAFCVVSPLVL
jgi:sodium-dependent dicarboxylate transporter 2/3/5